MNSIFFNGWEGLWRTVVVGTLAYISLILILRTTGKRTLSKLNAFDLVVTVALGSTLATILLNRNVALAEGTVGLLVLCGLQYLVTWTSVRYTWVNKVFKSEPRLLVLRGQPLHTAMKRERVTLEEVRAAVRSAKMQWLGEVGAVVLETDGTLSVIPAAHEFEAEELLSERVSPNELS